MRISTCCYIRNGRDWLMLYRGTKENDVNHGKWIGVGGKLEPGETPEECARREVLEETGLEAENLTVLGLMTFVYADREAEYIFIFKGETRSRALAACDEGTLAWIPEDKLETLALWEGDRLFLPYLYEKKPYFSLKLTYSAEDELLEAKFF